MRTKMTARGTAISDGDLISYSSGTTSTDPYSFRVMRNDSQLFESVVRRLPSSVVKALSGESPPMVINCYPMPLMLGSHAVLVDTYLSFKIFSRAFALAAHESLPCILVGQPLFVLDALIKHTDQGRPVPRDVVIASGGYYMPRSLEHTILKVLNIHRRQLTVVQLYGLAEGDSGVLISVERADDGQPIYVPRNDRVVIDERHRRLFLTLLDANGHPYIDNLDTGDNILRRERSGIVLENSKRMSEELRTELENWTPDLWKRRTGFMATNGDTSTTAWQLRNGVEAINQDEYDFYDFQKRFSIGTFLEKPIWVK